MDDTLRTLLITAFALFTASAACAEVTFIDADATARLERDFGSARAADLTAILAKPKWTCDMYGMRSKLYVERDVELYAFNRADDQASELTNTGDQLVEQYRAQGGTFAGENTKKGLRDELRLTKDGRLVGKLTKPSQKLTIAYAVCSGS